jgi:hypothetical protein
MPIDDPTDITNLVAWLPRTAASRLTTIAGSTPVASGGDTIGRWEDSSGAGNHFTSTGDDTTRPTYDAVNVGTVFDGTNDMLRRTSALGLYAAGAASLFVAVRGTASPAGIRRFMFVETPNSGNGIYSLLASGQATANPLSGWVRNEALGIQANPVPLPDDGGSNFDLWNDTAEHVIGVVDTGSTLTAWIDGVKGTAVAYTRSGTLSPNRVSLGARAVDTPQSFLNGTLHEVAVYTKAVDDTEAADLSNYLAGVVADGQPTSKRHGGVPFMALPGRGNVWAPVMGPTMRARAAPRLIVPKLIVPERRLMVPVRRFARAA